MRPIDAEALYERVCNLETEALDHIRKIVARDGGKASTDWKIWSAILAERTAFKHDVFDAQTVEDLPSVEPDVQTEHNMGYCERCKHQYQEYDEYPCSDCVFNCAVKEKNFEPWEF